MNANATVQDVTHRLMAAMQDVREGDLGLVGSMIAMIDQIDADTRPPTLSQLRDGLASLLMTQNGEFQREFDALRAKLQAQQTAAPALEPPAPGEAGAPAAAPPGEASLYQRLGGQGAIQSVVSAFYQKVLNDATLAPLFKGVDVGRLKRHQALFLSQATGGPKQYEGRELGEVHKHLRITPEHFNRVSHHLLATLRQLDVAPEETDQVINLVESLRPYIVSPLPAQGAPAAAAGPAPAEESERPPEGIDAELYSEFVDDAVSHLETIEMSFLSLETDPGNTRIIDEIFRPFHTIKGVSGYLGLTEISRICHETENLLDQGRKGSLEITGSVSDLVLEVVDFIKKLLAAVRESDTPHKSLKRFRNDVERHIQRVARVRADPASASRLGASQAAPLSPPAPPLGEILVQNNRLAPDDLDRAMAVQAAEGGHLGEILVKEGLARPVEVAQALRQQQAAQPSAALNAPESSSTAVTSDTIRVRVTLLDRLMTLAGELVLGRNQLLQKLSGLSEEVTGLNSLLHSVDLVTSDLQEAVMQTRMQPLSGLFSRFHRVIRDLARALGKKIELTVEGETVELDKTLIEALTDPLTHLIRNCADHGIEKPADRRAKGKPETGLVSLVAFHEGGRVYVRVRDDGAGVNLERVKEKAVEKGIVPREKATQMSDREALRLLFLPGFSTAEQVTGVSGRGVGMDVVLRNIQNVGGTVEIVSEPDKGTTFLLALPLTLAIIPALIVSAARQRFAIPQSNLVELVYLEGADAESAILNVRGSEVYNLRGEMLPLVRLNRVLNVSASNGTAARHDADAAADRSLSIVVMAAGTSQFGLAVERVFDTEEIVVQPLSNLLKDVGVFAGATLMGDGQAALILDIAGLMKAAELSLESQGAGDSLVARTSDEEASHEDDQTILLFNINRNEQMAVPLTIVSRLETLRMSDIRTSIHGKVIPYRDKMLPLIFLEEHSPVAPPPPDRETVKVLVFEIEKPVGLVVTEIIDSLEVAVSMEESSLTPPGFSGLAMVNGLPTAFLDIYQVIELAYPKWFHKGKDKRAAQPDKEPARVLLVEDSSFYRNMEKSYLVQEGFHVLEAENGQRAWELMQREPVDLVVTDIEMPELNGFELTRRIRADENLRHLPVIAVTSLSKEEERGHGMEAGLDSYLIKLQRDELLKEIHTLLLQRRQMN